MIVAEEIKVMKRRHRLPPHCLRFAPALPLRGTSLREDGLHEAEAVRPSNSNRAITGLTLTNNPYTS